MRRHENRPPRVKRYSMRSQTPYVLSMIIIAGLLAVASLGFTQPKKTEHGHATHPHTAICSGFVLLPNGYAVLSAVTAESAAKMKHADHGASRQPKAAMSEQPMSGNKERGHQQAHARSAITPSDHLMGHRHGDDIAIRHDMLCVPISGPASTSWTSVSSSAGLHVTAKSGTGPLAHNSRGNESLAFHMMRDGKPIAPDHIQVIARMPHHDHWMPGGHGPANDPDAAGIEATPNREGHYVVSTVDFSMAGAWLFEVRIKQGDQMHHAYFATQVGED